MLVLSFALASCGVVTPPPTTTTESTTTTVTTTEPTPDEPKEDVVEIIDGYIWVNGVNTGIEAKPEDTPDVVEVIDGYIYVNGVNTGIQAKPEEKPDVIEIIDGYIWVNGVNTGIKAENCDHVWNTVTTAPTCTAGGYDTVTCKICDKSYTDNETAQLEHTYESVYTIDDDYHWYKCVGCDDVKDKESHTLDDDGVCTICENPISATPGVIYDISSDGTYAEVVGYEGTATNVKIAEEYNGLPVKNIYDKAFENNTVITNVIISDSVERIGKEAFSSCSSLVSVVISDSVIILDECAFTSCYKLTSVVIGKNVEFIGYRAFAFCHSLVSVDVPNSVTYIGSGAFSSSSKFEFNEYKNCKYVGNNDNPYFALIEPTNDNLSSYDIYHNTKLIASSAFYGCSRLKSIIIPNSVINMGEQVFYNCVSLETVILSNNITAIESMTFQNCANLLSITIPESIKSIGYQAFTGCNSLKKVDISSLEQWFKITFHENTYANPFVFEAELYINGEIVTQLVIPEGVTNIDQKTFCGCSSITSVVIPISITSIGYETFYKCSNLQYVYYIGTEEEWSQIVIAYNRYLNNATVYYNYTPEE